MTIFILCFSPFPSQTVRAFVNNHKLCIFFLLLVSFHLFLYMLDILSFFVSLFFSYNSCRSFLFFVCWFLFLCYLVSECSTKSPQIVNRIFEAFILRLTAFENIISLVDGINILSGEINNTVFEEIKLLFICMVSILRINTVMNHEREKAASTRGGGSGGMSGGTGGAAVERGIGFLLAVIPIPEEYFEKFLRFLHFFFIKNLSNDLKKGSSMIITSSSSSSSSSSSTRGTDSPPPTAIVSTMISPSKSTAPASVKETKELLFNEATKQFITFLVSYLLTLKDCFFFRISFSSRLFSSRLVSSRLFSSLLSPISYLRFLSTEKRFLSPSSTSFRYFIIFFKIFQTIRNFNNTFN
jgi:hypothetical protein